MLVTSSVLPEAQAGLFEKQDGPKSDSEGQTPGLGFSKCLGSSA